MQVARSPRNPCSNTTHHKPRYEYQLDHSLKDYGPVLIATFCRMVSGVGRMEWTMPQLKAVYLCDIIDTCSISRMDIAIPHSTYPANLEPVATTASAARPDPSILARYYYREAKAG
jgi:hypothetical protein